MKKTIFKAQYLGGWDEIQKKLSNRIQESGARIQLGILYDWRIAQRKPFSTRGCANGIASLRASLRSLLASRRERLNNRRFCTPTKQENLVVQQFSRGSESPTDSVALASPRAS